MALPTKQLVSVNLASGVQTKADPKQVVGKLLRNENGIFTSTGRIKKRNGYAALGQAVSGSIFNVSAACGLATYLDELLLSDGSNLYSYNTSTDDWIPKGSYTPCHVDLNPIVRNTYEQQSPDQATHSSGLQVFAWEDSQGGIRYSLVDQATGLNVVHDQPLDGDGTRPKVAAIGNFLVVFYVVEASNTLYYRALNVATRRLTSPTPVTNELTDSFIYDASVISERCFIVYAKAGSPDRIGAVYLTRTLAMSDETEITGVPTTCLTVFADSLAQNAVVAWHETLTVKVTAYNYDLAHQVFATQSITSDALVVTLTGVAIPGDASIITLFWTVSNISFKSRYVTNVCTVTDYVPGTPTTLLRSVGLCGKAFVSNDTSYAPVCYDSSSESGFQNTLFVADSLGNLIARVMVGVHGGLPTGSLLPETNSLDGLGFTWASLVKESLTTESGAVFTPTGVNQVGVTFLEGAAGSGSTLEVPDVVLNLVATPASGQVELTWDPPVNATAAAVTGYHIVVSNGDTFDTSDTTITVTGLSNWVLYTFTVQATSVTSAGPGTSVDAMPIAVGPTPSGDFFGVTANSVAVNVIGLNIAGVSADTGTWVTTSTSIGNMRAVASRDGTAKVMAVGDSGTGAISLDNGGTWNPLTLPSGNWLAVKWIDYLSMWVACGGGVISDLGCIATSIDDGANWVSRTSPDGDMEWTGIATNGAQVVLCGRDANTGVKSLMAYSATATSWTTTSAGGPVSLYAIDYAAFLGLYVSVGYSADGTCVTSPNGTAWTPRTATGALWQCIANDGTRLLIMGMASGAVPTTVAKTSTNATSWTAQVCPSGIYQSVCRFSAAGLFVGVGISAVISTSATGATGTWASH